MDAKTLCLAVVNQSPASGYEIKKTLESPPYSHFQDTGFGSIYPALTRLAEAGLVEVTQLAQRKRPDKKVYSITEAGRAALTEELRKPPAPDRYRSDFLFILFHGELLPSDHLMGVIDQRIAGLEEQIARMEDCRLCAEPPTRQLVHAFGLDYYRNAAGFLRTHRDRLRDALARADSTAAPETLVAE